MEHVPGTAPFRNEKQPQYEAGCQCAYLEEERNVKGKVKIYPHFLLK